MWELMKEFAFFPFDIYLGIAVCKDACEIIQHEQMLMLRLE